MTIDLDVLEGLARSTPENGYEVRYDYLDAVLPSVVLSLTAAARERDGLREALTYIAGEKNDGGDQAWNGTKWVPIRDIARQALQAGEKG